MISWFTLNLSLLYCLVFDLEHNPIPNHLFPFRPTANKTTKRRSKWTIPFSLRLHLPNEFWLFTLMRSVCVCVTRVSCFIAFSLLFSSWPLLLFFIHLKSNTRWKMQTKKYEKNKIYFFARKSYFYERLLCVALTHQFYWIFSHATRIGILYDPSIITKTKKKREKNMVNIQCWMKISQEINLNWCC